MKRMTLFTKRLITLLFLSQTMIWAKGPVKNLETSDSLENNLATSFTATRTVYVNFAATGANDGTSWLNAYTDLQDALTTSIVGEEIWVAAGTYTPGSTRTDTFTIDTNGVTIYGGFDGTETTISERDISTNPTILSGDVTGNDAALTNFHGTNATRYDNSYHVVTVNANDILIDGVKIEDGYANDTAVANGEGASINVIGTSENLILKNSEINDHFSLYGGLRAGFTVDTDMTIQNCSFNNNHARWASGLYVTLGTGSTVTLNLINTIFTNNSSVDIYNQQTGYTGSSAWVRASGASSNLTTNIINCTFSNNSDQGTNGNAIEIGTLGLSRAATSVHNVTVSNSIFYSNTRSGATTLAFSKGNGTSPSQTLVYNSIDQDGFSNVAPTDLFNTLSSDPLFIDASNNDFTLQATSPAVNAGDNSKLPSGIITDLAGNRRILNLTIDMGAYEYIPRQPTTIYVNSAATGANDGTSWLNGYTDLQDALTTSIVGEEIWVAAGTYTPGSARADTFTIETNGVTIYGGFDGTETTISERDISTNATILSGDVTGNDAALTNNHGANATRYDNSLHVVTVNANNILIDGVKIEDGYANDNSIANGEGASINVIGTSENLILKNSEINDHFSLYGGLRARFTVDTDMTIQNCSFNNNHARFGSGLYVTLDTGSTVTLNLTNTIFTNNSSIDIYNQRTGYTGSSAWMRASATGSNLTTNIINCTFSNNNDEGTHPNAIEIGTLGLSRAATSVHNVTVSNSIFYNNTRSGATTLAFSKGNGTSPSQTLVYNSIDQDGFSNVAPTDLFNVLNSDPLFTDATNNDFTLQATSPAVNAGDNSKLPSGIITDLTGNARIANSTVDMGAYEFTLLNTWAGTTNDWHTATNWSTGVVPVQAETVVIPSGLTTYPTSTTDVYFDNLTIEAGATYIPEGFVNIGGTVNAKINIPDTNWHLIAPPVNSGTLDALLANHSFATGSGSNVGLATYDTTTDGWNYFNASSTGSTPITEGMSIKLTAADDVTFTGSIHQSDYSATLSSGNTANFNLIGNPFTSYVNSATFLSDNNNGQLSQQTIWLWNGTSYQTVNMNTTMEIAPGQGFFVEFDPSSIFNTSANFSTANRSHQATNTFLKQEATPNFELFVAKDATKTGTKVYYVADKTTGFDNGYDSTMFGGTSYDFAVFTELVSNNEGDKLAIQTLAREDTSVIPVGIIAKAGEELSFSVASVNLPAGTSVYLEDTKNGAFVNLSETTYKTTLSEDSTTTGQFYIHTAAKSLSTNDVIGLDTVSIYKSSNSQVTITGLQSDANVSLYSLLGKEVMTTNISSNGVSTVNLPSLSTGVYIVKLASDNGTITKKITLN